MNVIEGDIMYDFFGYWVVVVVFFVWVGVQFDGDWFGYIFYYEIGECDIFQMCVCVVVYFDYVFVGFVNNVIGDGDIFCFVIVEMEN